MSLKEIIENGNPATWGGDRNSSGALILRGSSQGRPLICLEAEILGAPHVGYDDFITPLSYFRETECKSECFRDLFYVGTDSIGDVYQPFMTNFKIQTQADIIVNRYSGVREGWVKFHWTYNKDFPTYSHLTWSFDYNNPIRKNRKCEFKIETHEDYYTNVLYIDDVAIQFWYGKLSNVDNYSENVRRVRDMNAIREVINN